MKLVVLMIALALSNPLVAKESDQETRDRLAILKHEHQSTASEIAYERKIGNTSKVIELEKDLAILEREIASTSGIATAFVPPEKPRATQRRITPSDTSKQDPRQFESWDIFKDFGQPK